MTIFTFDAKLVISVTDMQDLNTAASELLTGSKINLKSAVRPQDYRLTFWML